MKLRRCALVGVLAVVLALALAAPAWAQGGLTLSLRKVVGGNLGSKVQGRFTLSVQGVAGITAVTYEIDGAPMATVTQAPFSLSFDTGQYPLGVHHLSATAATPTGPVKSNEIAAEFVSGVDVMAAIAPILLGILALALVAAIGPQLLSGGRKRRYDPNAPHDYGVLGGAVCPKCERPVVLSVLGVNLLVGKLQRCPYCGHWAVLRRASPAALAAAEAKAAATEAGPAAAPPAPLSEEEKLRRQIDDSRYQE